MPRPTCPDCVSFASCVSLSAPSSCFRVLSQHPAQSVPTPESSSRLHFRLLTAFVAFALRDRLGSLLFPLTGLTCRCCKSCPEPVEGFTLCYGLLFCFPFSGTFGNASTQSVTRLHWLPAIRRPDTYRNWTFTSEQTMTFQDTPRCVRRLLFYGAVNVIIAV
jgi:hypothetical protein